MTLLAYLPAAVLVVMYLRKIIHRERARDIYINGERRHTTNTVMKRLMNADGPLSDGKIAEELYPKE